MDEGWRQMEELLTVATGKMKERVILAKLVDLANHGNKVNGTPNKSDPGEILVPPAEM